MTKISPVMMLRYVFLLLLIWNCLTALHTMKIPIKPDSIQVFVRRKTFRLNWEEMWIKRALCNVIVLKQLCNCAYKLGWNCNSKLQKNIFIRFHNRLYLKRSLNSPNLFSLLIASLGEKFTLNWNNRI